jgi:hypothetical protein
MSKELKILSEYQFDTSTYSILKEGFRRESETGKLIPHNSSSSKSSEKLSNSNKDRKTLHA